MQRRRITPLGQNPDPAPGKQTPCSLCYRKYLGDHALSTQTHLFPEPPEQPTAPPPRPSAPGNAVAPVWLQRVSLFILVIFCVYLGVIVTVLPWWTSVWDHNLFFTAHPLLWSFLRLGPVRGVISGLGLLDIWIGISEAINYRDQRN